MNCECSCVSIFRKVPPFLFLYISPSMKLLVLRGTEKVKDLVAP